MLPIYLFLFLIIITLYCIASIANTLCFELITPTRKVVWQLHG